ncbi:hypothetical protein POPTR_002G055950v4 [Populus trichocarpa]|uniref:Uncharacterized protein n=1 Tax=Populus trichocarpa TaxID=3694 RepID=A0ACC0TCI8_POPTR|nr:hypothetical protein POPTR_002G055950v4 [Populus trichocarpa]
MVVKLSRCLVNVVVVVMCVLCRVDIQAKFEGEGECGKACRNDFTKILHSLTKKIHIASQYSNFPNSQARFKEGDPRGRVVAAT